MSTPEVAMVRQGVVPTALSTILSLGGDERSVYLPDTGLNRYGCAVRPRPGVLSLGSCTCSSPDEAAITALRPLWEAYADATARGEALAWLAKSNALVREAIAAHFGLAQADVVLTPSGTDAQFVVAWMALAAAPEPVCSILVGAAEAGSGTALAASGRRFSTSEPLQGAPVVVGETLEGFPAERVRLVHVALRDAAGHPRAADDIESEVEFALGEAVSRGDRCLLHVMAHSKTGLHAPRLDAVERWRARWSGRVQVLVDAAQGRVAPPSVADWVARGYWVQVTGSKFFGAPPFAGALLLPCGQAPAGAPRGLAAYLSRWDLPERWHHAADSLAEAPNVGLTFRWRAALATMHAHAALPDALRCAVALGFAARLKRAFRDLPGLVWHEAPADLSAFDAEPPTVFSFTLRPSGRPLDMAALRKVHAALNGQDGDTTERFHLGQPVLLGHEGPHEVAVLRIALGAPLCNQLATDGSLGADLAARLAWLDERFDALRDALAALMQRVDAQVEVAP